MDSTKTLLSLIRSSDSIQVQNALMRATDREVAIVLRYMGESERGELLAKVAPAKARRIQDEIAMQKHLHVSTEQYDVTVSRILNLLAGRPVSSSKSYIRPRSPGARDRR